MKTPEEIKKGLAYCANDSCCDCPYDIGLSCCDEVMLDALAYIQQLESRLAQAERERGAAVADIHTVLNNRGVDADCVMCNMKKPECNWKCENAEWRGVCPENSKEGECGDQRTF